jgi:hypothetical protein
MPIISIADTSAHGLVAPAIIRYLEQHDKCLDEQVLHEMEAMFRRSVMKQLMQPRESRKHYESNSLYAHPCSRKARLTYDGAERRPAQARTLLKFFLGDIVELAVLGIARLAGVDIGMNNIDLSVQGESDMKLVPVHPDGLLNVNGKLYNCEIKSCDSHTFDRWLAEGGPGDDWGYRTQATVEIQAWRENMLDVNETVFIAVSTGTRQGSIAEWRLPFEPKLLEAWQARRALRQGHDVPPVPFSTEPVTEYLKGKELDAEFLSSIRRWGEPTPRLDKNGKIHGWDVPTGLEKVCATCSYCDFTETCYPGVEMQERGGKPVWIVPRQNKLI